VSRANSATADAYLTPVTRRYIESFGSGFEGGLEAFGNKLLFMQSDGGLCAWDSFSGLRAILSGPAGGVIGYSKTCYDESDGTALIAVDMGGMLCELVDGNRLTNTAYRDKYGRFTVCGQAGACLRDYNSRGCASISSFCKDLTATPVIIQAPQLDINTVAAGGGSRLFYRHGMFVVGPEVSLTNLPGLRLMAIVCHCTPWSSMLSQRGSLGGDRCEPASWPLAS
jgi:5-oxoprolinase (ATP-hydrolysing)